MVGAALFAMTAAAPFLLYAAGARQPDRLQGPFLVGAGIVAVATFTLYLFAIPRFLSRGRKSEDGRPDGSYPRRLLLKLGAVVAAVLMGILFGYLLAR